MLEFSTCPIKEVVVDVKRFFHCWVKKDMINFILHVLKRVSLELGPLMDVMMIRFKDYFLEGKARSTDCNSNGDDFCELRRMKSSPSPCQHFLCIIGQMTCHVGGLLIIQTFHGKIFCKMPSTRSPLVYLGHQWSTCLEWKTFCKTCCLALTIQPHNLTSLPFLHWPQSVCSVS